MNHPCLKCGFDPHARVTASWSTTIHLEIQSGNSHVVNAGGTRWKYAKARADWSLAFKVMRNNQRVPRPLGRRRVTITRLYDGRQREWDQDNMTIGCKLVLDAMVREGLLVDDKRAFAEVHYEQRKGMRGTVVLIEELADATSHGDSATSSTSSKPLTKPDDVSESAIQRTGRELGGEG